MSKRHCSKSHKKHHSPRKPLPINAYGIDVNNKLIAFNTSSPKHIISSQVIIGLQAPGEMVLGLTIRPLNGVMYVLGSSSRIYTLDPENATVAVIGAGLPFNPLLQGTEFGFDFNPTVDRIRIVSNVGQNLRANPDTGAVAFTDTPLSYAPNDVNAGKIPRVSAAAYTNSFVPPTTTVLYDIDPVNNVLATQNPPNNGTLNTVGSLFSKKVKINPLYVGFDIQPPQNMAYLSLVVDDASELYTVDLATGAATRIGVIGKHQHYLLRALAILPLTVM